MSRATAIVVLVMLAASAPHAAAHWDAHPAPHLAVVADTLVVTAEWSAGSPEAARGLRDRFDDDGNGVLDQREAADLVAHCRDRALRGWALRAGITTLPVARETCESEGVGTSAASTAPLAVRVTLRCALTAGSHSLRPRLTPATAPSDRGSRR